jgi:4-amino-4-deoxy-L-arabinose transferase-like glycosyltransferase
VNDAFPTPFSVLYRERWFAQYPPGTAALLALGMLVQLPWLVQPLLAVGAVALIVLAARRQYGPGTALIVLVLLVTSPFLLLTAGAFLSHVPALFFVSVALYAVTQYVERPSVAWAALVAIGLALVLLTREIVIIPYGIVFAVVGLVCGGPKRGRSIVVDALVAAVILGTGLGLYLGYNAAITGDPFLLPRHLFNGSDVLGFGPGVGFYGEHTVASGLVNAEQQLVSLGFYLAGWPFVFSLAVLLLPFLLGRLTAWDLAHGAVVGLYVALYVAEFYHGIAFGPRYYFEALPALMILTARGFVVLAESVADWLAALGVHGAWWRARQATALIAIALFACNTLYFLPRQATLYANYTGLPGGGPALDETIGRDLAGRVSRLDNALVVTDQWWWYTMYFAAMNCPRFDCPTVFALGADPEAREVLHRMFEDRDWYNVVLRNGVLTIVRGAP